MIMYSLSTGVQYAISSHLRINQNKLSLSSYHHPLYLFSLFHFCSSTQNGYKFCLYQCVHFPLFPESTQARLSAPSSVETALVHIVFSSPSPMDQPPCPPSSIWHSWPALPTWSILDSQLLKYLFPFCSPLNALLTSGFFPLMYSQHSSRIDWEEPWK